MLPLLIARQPTVIMPMPEPLFTMNPPFVNFVHVSERMQGRESMAESGSLLQKSSLDQVATVPCADTSKETASSLSHTVRGVECISLGASGLQKGESG